MFRNQYQLNCKIHNTWSSLLYCTLTRIKFTILHVELYPTETDYFGITGSHLYRQDRLSVALPLAQWGLASTSCTAVNWCWLNLIYLSIPTWNDSLHGGTYRVWMVFFGVEAEEMFEAAQQVETFAGVVVTNSQRQRMAATIWRQYILHMAINRTGCNYNGCYYCICNRSYTNQYVTSNHL